MSSSPAVEYTSRTTNWLRLRKADLLMWCVVMGSFVVGLAGYVVRSTFVYPDSRYYIAMTLRFAGKSPEEARTITEGITSVFGIAVPETDVLFGWGLVQPRVVLPLLASVPTRIFGVYWGLVLTVFVINLILTILMTVILKRRYGNSAAMLALVLINSSMYLQAFKAGMLTESLSALWTTLSLLAAWKWIKDRTQWALWAVFGTVLASAFTRQATLIVAGAFASAWILGLVIRRTNEWMAPALVAVGTSIGAQVFQTLVFPFSQAGQFMRMTETDTVGEALLATPGLLVGIIQYDTYRFLTEDLPLLVFILLALVSLLLFFRSQESHLLFGAILGFAVYNITNGNATQFRYAVPGLIFYALSVGLLTGKASLQRRSNPAIAAET